MTVEQALAEMRGLPMRDVDAVVGGGTALILAPHADDESLGCGGLIAECCARKRPPVVLVLTDGVGSHPHSVSYPPERLRMTRQDEARRAAASLGLGRDRVGFLALPDTAAPHDGSAFDSAVEAILQWWSSTTDYTAVVAPWQYDPHCDHLAAHRMAAAVAKRLRVSHVAYPVWGWTLPPQTVLDTTIAGARLDITRHLSAKRRAISAHQSQLGGLITDDPDGFQLPLDLLTVFDMPYEVFLHVR